MFVQRYQFLSEVSVIVWVLGGMGLSATSAGEEKGMGQFLAWEQSRSGKDHTALVMTFLRPGVLMITLKHLSKMSKRPGHGNV